MNWERGIDMSHVNCQKGDYRKVVFEISAQEHIELEARVLLSGLPKGNYYKSAVLDKRIEVYPGIYVAERLRVTLEKLMKEAQNGNLESEQVLTELIRNLLEYCSKEKTR